MKVNLLLTRPTFKENSLAWILQYIAVEFVGGVNSDIENGQIKDDASQGQLYNLEVDIYQSTNLYDQYPEIVKEMEDILEGYRPNYLKKSEK